MIRRLAAWQRQDGSGLRDRSRLDRCWPAPRLIVVAQPKETTSGERTEARQPGGEEAEGFRQKTGRRCGSYTISTSSEARRGQIREEVIVAGGVDRRAASSDLSALTTTNITFEIRSGIHRVQCGVANEALDAASGCIEPSTPALRRRSFDRFRTLIHEAAMIQFGARPPGCVDPILVTSADLRRVPSRTGSPNMGTLGRDAMTARPAKRAAPVSQAA